MCFRSSGCAPSASTRSPSPPKGTTTPSSPPGEAAFSTGALPDFIPDYEFSADPTRTAEGVTLIEVVPFDQQQPVPASVIAVDNEGEVVWYYQWSATLDGIEQSPAGTFTGHNYPFSLVEFDVLGETTVLLARRSDHQLSRRADRIVLRRAALAPIDRSAVARWWFR